MKPLLRNEPEAAAGNPVAVPTASSAPSSHIRPSSRPINIAAPRITSAESPRGILAADFKSLGGELPIQGGWGYTRDDAIIIDKDDPAVPLGIPFDPVSVEYVVVEKRIYEELIIFRPESERHSGIKWRLLKQNLSFNDGRKYDVLRFEVTALRDRDWKELKEEWEGPHGVRNAGFDTAAHMRKREAKMIRYETEYWFDITNA